jgi:hypothetical protein
MTDKTKEFEPITLEERVTQIETLLEENTRLLKRSKMRSIILALKKMPSTQYTK